MLKIMLICAFDIGIKNLAFCLLKAGDNCHEIVDWRIVDLSDSDGDGVEKKDVGYEKCCSCGKKATYLWEGKKYCAVHLKKFGKYKYSCCKDDCDGKGIWLDNSSQRFCTKHRVGKVGKVGKKEKMIVDDFLDVTKLGKEVKKCCCKTKIGKECKLKVHLYCENDEGNKYYCKKHGKGVNELSEIKVKKNANKISPLELALSVNKELDKFPELLKAEYVILENQPGLTNPIMKRMQSFVFQYFVIRGIIDKERTGGLVKNVISMNATNKLKVFKGEAITKFNHLKNAKDRRKKLGIEHTLIFLKQMEGNGDVDKWLKMFNESKKKDDLSDAFLYCLYQNESLKNVQK